jgi:hypothetical protein
MIPLRKPTGAWHAVNKYVDEKDRREGRNEKGYDYLFEYIFV